MSRTPRERNEMFTAALNTIKEYEGQNRKSIIEQYGKEQYDREFSVAFKIYQMSKESHNPGYYDALEKLQRMLDFAKDQRVPQVETLD